MAVRVAIVSSEAAPFAKTGGLADMVGSLAVALTRRGLDVTLVLPAYRCILERDDVAATGMAFQVPAAGGIERTDILAGVAGGGTPAYFVRADRFFDRDGLYGQGGADYPDNADRFAFFARSALALLARLGPPDVLHGHDWQASLAFAYPGRCPSTTRPWSPRARCSPCTTSGTRDCSTPACSRVSRWTLPTTGRTSSSTAASASSRPACRLRIA